MKFTSTVLVGLKVFGVALLGGVILWIPNMVFMGLMAYSMMSALLLSILLLVPLILLYLFVNGWLFIKFRRWIYKGVM